MKNRILFLLILAGLTIACGSARKAEAERKRTKEKMEELDKNKESFKMKNPG